MENLEVKECTTSTTGFNVGTFFIGMLGGVLIGGLTVLFLAPKSGKETREMIVDKASQTQQMLMDKVNQVKAKASSVKENMRSSAEKEMQSAEKK
jgi:gas vesicle protein